MATKYRQIGEHLVPIPPLPKNKEDILFVNEKKENAFWRRLEFPKIWYDFVPYDIPKGPKKTRVNQSATLYNSSGELVSLSEDDSALLMRLLKQEIKRRTKGVFIKNYDEIIWLPPGYYNTLQWSEMKDYKNPDTGTGHGQFRLIQNDVLTLWEYVKAHPAHIGINFPKCKKSGITQIISTDILNEASLNDGMYPMVSKEYDAVVDVNIAYVLHAFDSWPLILRPEVHKRNEHEIVFGLPKNKTKTDGSNYLVSHIYGTKTKPTCFDGPVVRRGIIDEPPKMWEASKVRFETLYKKTLETVRLQQKKNGTLMTISYMPEVDDQGFRDYRDHYNKSKLSTVSEATGTTESMYINFPIPASKSNEMCFDRHGRCDEVKAASIILAERATKKTTSDKQAHRRTNPIDENDMFDSGGRGTTFDNLRLSLHHRDLKTELESGVRPYREGHLRWKISAWEDGYRPKDQFCEVYFEELTDQQLLDGEEGSILIFHDLPEAMLNLPIKRNSRAEDGHLSPIGSIAVGAFDPTDYKLKKDVAEGSKNGAYGGLLDDPALDTQMGHKVTDVPIFEYLFRHNNPDLTEEDLYKMMIYWNMLFIIEANKGWLVTSVKLANMHHFLLLLQANGSIEPYREGDENSLVNTTRDMINVYCRAINRYLADPKGGAGIDMLKLLKAIRLLMQLMDFDVMNPKAYDAVVSFGYWRVAVEAFMVYLLNHPESDDGGAMLAAAEGLLDF